MKKIFTLTLMAAALMLLPSQHASAQYFDHLALGVTVGIDGFGLELAAPLGGQFQVRAGYSMLPPMWKPHSVFHLEESKEHNKVDVDLEAITKLGGANLLVDWHPGGNNFFFITAGMYAGSPKILSVRNKAPFLDEEDWGKEGIVINNVMVTTDDKGIVEGSLNVWPVRPYVGLGFGNAINANKRVCFNFELGTCFTKGYTVKVTGENLETFESGTVPVTSADLWKKETAGCSYTDADAEARADKNNYEDRLILEKMGKFPLLPVVKFGLYVRLF